MDLYVGTDVYTYLVLVSIEIGDRVLGSSPDFKFSDFTLKKKKTLNQLHFLNRKDTDIYFEQGSSINVFILFG